MGLPGIQIRRLVDLEAKGIDRAAVYGGVVKIFRATAAKWPTDADAARAFQDLWLDQYLSHERDLAFVALATSADPTAPEVVGYLVGCRINPAVSPRFARLGYFQVFASACAAFPAHLHVNLDAAYRGRAIGAQLVEALCAQLCAEHCPGVHVVTGRDMRNTSFYQRLGFTEQARTARGATEVVLLGRRLTS
jgi:GNAT superfamily N-acetyltransferase